MLDMTGKRCGRLTVQSFSHQDPVRKQAWWVCLCDCGKTLTTHGARLRNGDVQSCGCYRNDRVMETCGTHKASGHPVYNSWVAMMDRCYHANRPHYPNYGGRGIKVCDRWLDVLNFIEDMEKTWSKGMTLEREDVDGDYSPDNCVWATRKQQADNKRNTRRVTLISGEVVTLTEAAKITGMNRSKLYHRLKRGAEGALLFARHDLPRKVFKVKSGLAMLSTFLISCAGTETLMVRADGSMYRTRKVLVGGDHIGQDSDGSKWGHTLTTSFRDLAIAATAVAGAAYSASTAAAKEVTTQAANKNATALGIVDSNNAKEVAVETLNAGVKEAAIKAAQ